MKVKLLALSLMLLAGCRTPPAPEVPYYYDDEPVFVPFTDDHRYYPTVRPYYYDDDYYYDYDDYDDGYNYNPAVNPPRGSGWEYRRWNKRPHRRRR